MSAFLSHPWAKKPLVEALIPILRARGITYWVEVEQMRPGDLLLERTATPA